MKKRNKKLAIGLAVVLLLVGGTTVFAKTGTEKISARFSNIKLIVNDQVIKTKAEPFIYNGNVYAPVATVANALGIKQEWDNKTPAVRFSDAGGNTGGSNIPEAIVQQAKNILPLPCDPSDVKGSLYFCGPEREVVSKGYVNLTGTSDQEFLVMYRYHSIEGIPWEAYLTLFRQSNGKVVPVNTSQVYKMSN
ncbi:stalk domain-containing protein [Brevibacillus sp. 179-C9.3 HS]|uniref:stalk domain-containing protein n=1 Tax=unclassified Brevibacillus TaxID=2684853 RepID=UPI0039A1CE05